MSSESFLLSDDLAAYIEAHSPPPDAVAESLFAATAELGDFEIMRISAPQGAFMGMLASVLRPRFAVEVGTFTGYSALCVARALPPGGRLLCCDVSEEWTDIAREHWRMAGVEDRIDLEIAPAAETLAALDPDVVVDFAFVDADKTGYVDYYDALVPHLSPNGLMLFDNVLWSGAVIDPDDDSPDTVALRAFNDHAHADPRTEATLLSVGDGVLMVRRTDPT
jgi:caffeoyl-CoA O-methyltransferase